MFKEELTPILDNGFLKIEWNISQLIFKKINLFIYFWLRWVFVAAHGLSLVAASRATLRCGVHASHCVGFSCCRAQALGVWASAVVARGLSSCGAEA